MGFAPLNPSYGLNVARMSAQCDIRGPETPHFAPHAGEVDALDPSGRRLRLLGIAP
jgi:hypothetical protein